MKLPRIEIKNCRGETDHIQTSVFNQGVTKLLKQLDGRRGQHRPRPDTWLDYVCHELYSALPEFAAAGYLEFTERGFDWKLSPSLLARILAEYGFSAWTELATYFTVNGGPVKGSIKTMAVNFRTRRSSPRGWEFLIESIPSLR